MLGLENAIIRRHGQTDSSGALAVVMAAIIVGVDFMFFRDRFWERLTVNIGIVLVFAAFYRRFLNLHEAGSPVDQSDVVDATGVMRLTQNNDWISEKPSRGGFSFLVVQLCGCPLLAQSGHCLVRRTCPFLG